MVQCGKIIKICLFCHSKYKPTLVNGINKRQKYCSKLCKGRYWREHNKEKVIASRNKQWLEIKNIPKLCRYCKEVIPLSERQSGRVLHKRCVKLQAKINSKNHRDKLAKEFNAFKQRIGCKNCGYNKNGCSLDFHHNNPATKERRITAGLLRANSELFKKEIKKCTLLCKNCHHELHHIKHNR